jgi:hypothetical protein
MWAEAWKIIEPLLRGRDLSRGHVAEVLGIPLASTLDSAAARHYRARLPNGPFRDVELRILPETGVSVLVLRANPEVPIVVTTADLRSFGRAKWRSVEPKASPEGAVAECFDIRGVELKVGYRGLSRLLEAVSLARETPPKAS